MCYYHDVYNVHKLVKHLPPDDVKAVFRGLKRMHFATLQTDLQSISAAVITNWRKRSSLCSLARYFTKEWLDGRFWR
ncbi:TPA: hypothetical protein N0F65_008473 [Lagenidium giganteum]|uniref:Uncharacterized protein n=1 Tax=Lagenidium giganteum TaxID=4803 RepID=A0AAV2Z876_9STRA|nr:TPA: hypothetical protein N0F65_008473 [Lagenidium giganteum]